MTSLISPSASKSEPEAEPLSDRNQAKGPRPGLTSATALVVAASLVPVCSRCPRSRGSGHHGIAVLAVIAVRRDAARGPVRSAHQSACRIADGGVYAYSAMNSATSPATWSDGATGFSPGPATRRLCPHGSFYVDAFVQVLSPQWHGELGYRDESACGSRRSSTYPACVQMAWFQNVTVGLEVPAAALRWVSSAGFLSRRPTLDPSTPPVAVFTTASVSRPAWHSSRSLVLSGRHHG